jgi:hypothetical protein
MWVAAIAGVLAGTRVRAGQEEPAPARGPSQAAGDFYQACIRLRVSGLPDEKQRQVLKPLLAPELIEAIAAARREQEKAIKENPDEKPPWIEGNLFGSLFEGMHSFRLGREVINDDKASVPIYLEFREGKKVVRWIDVAVLVRIESRWAVWDIYYCGPWDFKPGSTLRQALGAR